MSDQENYSRGSLEANPFVALFPSLDEAIEYKSRSNDSNVKLSVKEIQTESVDITLSPIKDKEPDNRIELDVERITNNLLQRVFLITIDECQVEEEIDREYGGLPKASVFLSGIASDPDRTSKFLGWNDLDQALFERLLVENPSQHIVTTVGCANLPNYLTSTDPGQKKVFSFLKSCYHRKLEEEKRWKDKYELLAFYLKQCGEILESYVKTCLVQPELFPGQNPHHEFFTCMMALSQGQTDDEFTQLYQVLLKEPTQKDEIDAMFSPIIQQFVEKIKSSEMDLMHPDVRPFLNLFQMISLNKDIAELLVKCDAWLPVVPSYQRPAGAFALPTTVGASFEQKTVLGLFLGLSSIPRDMSSLKNFFVNPTHQTSGEMEATTSQLRGYLDFNCNHMTQICKNLLKSSPVVKHRFLQWIGSCLHENETRKKMIGDLFRAGQASDGFFLNLGNVLLTLCQPLMHPKSNKLTKVDPRYCVSMVTLDTVSQEEPTVHLLGLKAETKLCQAESEGGHCSNEDSQLFGSLLFAIRQLSNIDSFKRQLKTYLFTKSYGI